MSTIVPIVLIVGILSFWFYYTLNSENFYKRYYKFSDDPEKFAEGHRHAKKIYVVGVTLALIIMLVSKIDRTTIIRTMALFIVMYPIVALPKRRLSTFLKVYITKKSTLIILLGIGVLFSIYKIFF